MEMKEMKTLVSNFPKRNYEKKVGKIQACNRGKNT